MSPAPTRAPDAKVEDLRPWLQSLRASALDLLQHASSKRPAGESPSALLVERLQRVGNDLGVAERLLAKPAPQTAGEPPGPSRRAT